MYIFNNSTYIYIYFFFIFTKLNFIIHTFNIQNIIYFMELAYSDKTKVINFYMDFKNASHSMRGVPSSQHCVRSNGIA